jgi:hypothetical protein
MQTQIKWIISCLTVISLSLGGLNLSVAQAKVESVETATATPTQTMPVLETITPSPVLDIPTSTSTPSTILATSEAVTSLPNFTNPLQTTSLTPSAASQNFGGLSRGTLTTGIYNENHSGITYTSKWSAVSDSSASSGSYKKTSIYRQTASFSFYGSKLIIIHTKSKDSGLLQVTVDGTNYKLNAYNRKTQYQAQWESPVLKTGPHTVVIQKQNQDRRPIFLDGLIILDTTPIQTSTQLPTLIPTQTVVVPPSSTFTYTPTSVPTNTTTEIPTIVLTPTATLTSLPSSTSTQVPVNTATLTQLPNPMPTNTSTPIATSTVSSTPSIGLKAYYVSTTGNNADGKSWNTAWNGLNQINWSVIQPGDTIYISGGTTSKTYTGTLKVPAGTTGITITKGVDSGHNGEVIFDGGKSTQYGISINAEGTPVKSLTISKLTFKNYAGAGVYGSGQNSGGLQGIIVDNCKFLDFNRAGVFFEGNNNLNNNYNIVVKNSYFDDNNAGTGQSDGIYVQVLKDFTADHNYIILDNNYTGVADLHSDNIQSFWVDNVMYSNNVVIQKSNKTLGTQMLFTENGYGEHVFLNNVFIRNTPYAEDSAIRLKSANGSTFTAKVIGNTYYGKGRILNSSTITVIKNNIFYGISQPTGERTIYITSSGSDVSNNIFYDPNNQFPNASGGVDVNPMFISTDFNAIDLHLQPGSPAINAGANLGSQYIIDIEGKSRSSGWDIGAYEMISVK